MNQATSTQLDTSAVQNIIQSRRLASTPGQYSAKVTSVTAWVRESDGVPVHICNYALMTPFHLTEAKKFMREGDLQKAVNQQITSSQRDGKDYIPFKGEYVNIVLDIVTTKNGVTGLFPVSVTPMPTQTAPAVVFSLEEEEETAGNL